MSAANARFADAWVLLAVTYASHDQPPDLLDVVAAADFINHAILTYEELSVSLAHLVHRGMIQVSGDRFVPAGEVVAALPRGRSAVHADLRRIEKLLESTIAGPVGDPYALPRADYDAAVSAYTHQARRLTEQTRGRRRRTGVPR